MNMTQAFLVAGEVAASGGIDQKLARKGSFRALWSAGLDLRCISIRSGFQNGPALANVGPATAGMLEQNVIEGGAFDLISQGFFRKLTLAKEQVQRFNSVAQMK